MGTARTRLRAVREIVAFIAFSLPGVHRAKAAEAAWCHSPGMDGGNPCWQPRRRDYTTIVVSQDAKRLAASLGVPVQQGACNLLIYGPSGRCGAGQRDDHAARCAGAPESTRSPSAMTVVTRDAQSPSFVPGKLGGNQSTRRDGGRGRPRRACRPGTQHGSSKKGLRGAARTGWSERWLPRNSGEPTPRGAECRTFAH